MKKVFRFLPYFGVIFSLFAYQPVSASAIKYIRIGNFQVKLVDSGDQGEVSGSWAYATYSYGCFEGDMNMYSCNGYHLGASPWADSAGNPFPVKLSNSATASSDEVYNTMPWPDAEKITIRRYMRYEPTAITVDGMRLDEQFPRVGDEVNPGKIPGTADVMVESFVRTSMGMDIHMKVLAWNQENHDDYVVFDWTFTNTGNIDLDDVVEIPNQTLKDVYFVRETRPAGGWGVRSWRPERFFSAYGEYPADSLRMVYSYPARREGPDYDDCGRPHETHGFLRDVLYEAESMLHVDTSPTDHTNNPAAPQMTAVGHPEWRFIKHNASITTPAEHLEVYKFMQEGTVWYEGLKNLVDEGAYEGTHHAIRMEDRPEIKFTKELGYAGRGKSMTSSGPFTLEFGQSFRIVWADIVGGISPEKGWEVGNAWVNKTVIEPPSGYVFGGVPGVDDNLEPQYVKFPELFAADDKSTAENNWAKDCWIFTGKDTLFRNTAAAQWNFDNDYNVPIPPPPPKFVEVTSLPNKITIKWDRTQPEAVGDFAGYRVYRAVGNPGPKVIEDELVGTWSLLFECGEGTANALVDNYDDISAVRGKGYYYYVTAFDDGSDTAPDVWDPAGGKSLESGRHLTATTIAAHLTRDPASELSEIRVVPNPFNISARKLQYTGEKDKIMFMELPPVCTIKIYSESGDLVKTIEHTDGSGDEAWGVLEDEHSVTETGQVIVSGIYIAYIEIPEGESTFVKFVVVR